MSDFSAETGGEPGDSVAGPVAVTRPRRRWTLAFLALLAAGLPALLHGLGLLQGPERAIDTYFERHAPSPEPSGRVWIVRLDDESPRRLGVDDAFELWTRFLDRAAADGVERIVLLDPASFPVIAQVLAGRPEGLPTVLLPSRLKIDPLFEIPSGVERPLAEDHSTARRFEEALLHFEPDSDGTWRRMAARRVVQGTPIRTLAGALAPPGLADRPEFAPAFHRPSGLLPSTPAWSFILGDLRQTPWRGGTLVVCRDDALAVPAVWAPHGQPLSEPRAVAQLAESLLTNRLRREFPSALAIPVFLALFLGAVFATARLAPVNGFLAGLGATAVIVGAASAVRLSALWLFPLSPVLPVAAFGTVVGLVRRHRSLERRMAQAGVALGQSRALHPILRAFSLDAAVLRRAVDLLEIEGAALVDLRRPEAAGTVAVRGDQEPFVRRLREELPRLLEQGRPARALPLFSPTTETGPGALLIPLGPEGADRPHLYLLPRAGTPNAWWEGNREVLDRLCVSLAFVVEAAGFKAAGESIPPERQLEILQGTASRTEAERILLLRLLSKLPGGVLVCDLLGRTLLYNQALDRLAGGLRLAPENFLMGLLKTSSGRDQTALWRAVQQVVRDRAPWTFYAKTEVPEPRHHLFHLSLLDLGPGAAGVLPREVLVLAATDVTGIARMATSRETSESTAGAPPAFVTDACAVLARMLDVLQGLLAGGSVPQDDQIRLMREELESLKTPLSTLTRKDLEAVEAVDLVAEIERAVADAMPIATEVGIELRVRGDELVPMALVRPQALKRALALLLRKGVSSWRRAPTLWFQAYSTGTEVVLRMSTEGSPEGSRRLESGTRVSADALGRAVEEAGGRFGVGEEGDLRLAFPALAT